MKFFHRRLELLLLSIHPKVALLLALAGAFFPGSGLLFVLWLGEKNLLTPLLLNALAPLIAITACIWMALVGSTIGYHMHKEEELKKLEAALNSL
jgi:hypothetical protein